jgi:hypothetical protein
MWFSSTYAEVVTVLADLTRDSAPVHECLMRESREIASLRDGRIHVGQP